MEDYLKIFAERIADLFDELCEPTNKFWHRDSGLYWASKVMQLITADRKRVELGASISTLEDVYDDERPLKTSMDIKKRIAELKAQQEEV